MHSVSGIRKLGRKQHPFNWRKYYDVLNNLTHKNQTILRCDIGFPDYKLLCMLQRLVSTDASKALKKQIKSTFLPLALVIIQMIHCIAIF